MPDSKTLRRVHETRLREMVASMKVAESRLTAHVAKAIRDAESDPKRAASAAYWTDRLRDVKKATVYMDAKWRSWIGTKEGGAMRSAIRDGARLAIPQMQSYGLERKFSLPYDSKTVVSFIEDSTALWSQAMGTAENKVERLFRATQQDLIREREINFALTTEEIAGGAIQRMRSTLTQQLQENADNGQFLTINGRNYQIGKYAELVARTRTREAQTIGTIRTVQEFGIDLVKWKASADACEICLPFDGEIYSISGKSSEHPVLSESPPVHPHCTCTLTPYVEAA